MPSRELGVLGGLSTGLYFVTTVRSHPHAHVHCLRASRTRSLLQVGANSSHRERRVVGCQGQALHPWGG